MLEFFCLMVHGISLSEKVRLELILAAKSMLVDNKNKTKIKTQFCEGAVYTNFQGALLGSVSGVVFMAEIETGKGNTSVKYLIRADLLEYFNPDNLVSFSSSSKRQKQLAENAINN